METKELKKLLIKRFGQMPDNMRLMLGSKSYSGKDLIREINNESEDGKELLYIYSKYMSQFGNLAEEEIFKNSNKLT